MTSLFRIRDHAPWLMTGVHHDTNPVTLRRAIAYDEKYGSIKNIDTTWAGDSQARYDYTCDARRLRLTAKQSGAFYSDYGTPTYYHYDYNARGELTAARQYPGDDVAAQTQPLPGRQYGYAYDSMGNRLSTRRTSTPDSDLDEHCQINNLNQIVTKENKATPLSGTMLEGAKAYAAGAGVATPGLTKGRFWNIETLLPNATAPAKADLTIYFGKAGAAPGGADAFATQQRAAFQRQQNESCLHDNDGNLASDGLWEYTYDAENRLVAMETLSDLRPILTATPGEPQPRRLEFTYDHLGRRVGKKTCNWQNDTWVAGKHLKFIYDGWNLVAEYETDTSTSSLNLKRSFVWGLDCAGSLTATAGVGALLMIQTADNAYFPALDGNGNVAGLLDQDGSAAAKYEYNPYGELTRVEGPCAHENPFRWSTKYTDTETGLVYYGLRYYSPRTGRFINRDPIGEQGGLNLYGFVNNNPVGKIDILGLRECATFTIWKQKTYFKGGKLIVNAWKENYMICNNSGGTYINFGSADGGGGGGSTSGTNTNKDDVVHMEKMTVTAKRIKKQSLINPVQNNTMPAPHLRRPCWQVALELLNNGISSNETGNPSDQDRERLRSAMRVLVMTDNNMGAAMVLSWDSLDRRDVSWFHGQGSASGGRTINYGALELGSNQQLFMSGTSSELPQSGHIVVGHEMGHAAIGLNSQLTPSPLRIADGRGGIIDLGMESANVLLIENRLRAATTSSPFGLLLQSEAQRTTYNENNILDALGGTPERWDYFGRANQHINQVMDEMKEKYDCY